MSKSMRVKTVGLTNISQHPANLSAHKRRKIRRSPKPGQPMRKTPPWVTGHGMASPETVSEIVYLQEGSPGSRRYA